MNFNLNEFLISISFALDFVEMDILDKVTNHSKRVAYIAYKLGEYLGYSEDELFDLAALAIMHDNGTSSLFGNGKKVELGTVEGVKSHCIVGEENIRHFPFLTSPKNILKYHHENIDGSGFFGLKGDDIPIFSLIISLADKIEIQYNSQGKSQKEILDYLELFRDRWYPSEIIDAYIAIQKNHSYWLDISDMFVASSLKRVLPQRELKLSYDEIREVTKVISNIIDTKSKFTKRHSSGLSEKAAKMAEFYDFHIDKKNKFVIAADLHDIGKLAISNHILEKNGKLDYQEFKKIKEHTYYTRRALENLKGFEDITEWAANHHEKLNGKGYPYGLDESKLDFPSKLLTCLDIYQALVEERPYRVSLGHEKAISILKSMQKNGEIDGNIVKDIDKAFIELTK